MAIQTSKQAMWVDESGTSIPYKRITNAERKVESIISKVVKNATSVSNQLAALKDAIKTACEECETAFAAEHGIVRKENYKGNYIKFNFDRSVKIERSVNEKMTYDEETMQLAKELFMSFLKESLDSKNQWIKDMVLEAFETKSGKFDSKQISKLHKYEDRINNVEYSKACRLARQAERIPESNVYYRVWMKDESGKLKSIKLNLSEL